MAKTKIRVLNDVIEFYNNAPSPVAFTLGTPLDHQGSEMQLISQRPSSGLTFSLASHIASLGCTLRFMDAENTKWDISNSTTNAFEIKNTTGDVIFKIDTSNNIILQSDAVGYLGMGETPTSTNKVWIKFTESNDTFFRFENTGSGYASYLNLIANSYYCSLYLVATGSDWMVGKFGAASLVIRDHSGSANVATFEDGALANSIYANSVGVGIGTSSVANAFLVIAAGTTTKAAIKLTAGTNLTAATANCIEYNGDTTFSTNQRALRHAFGGIIYTTASDEGPTGTTTETTVLSASPGMGWATLTIPADYMIVGKCIVLKAWGHYTTHDGTTTFTIKFYFGSNYIATMGPITPGNGLTRKYWSCELFLTARNTGGANSRFQSDATNAYNIGTFIYDNGAANISFFNVDGTGSNDVFTSTSANAIDLKCTIGGSYTNASFKCVNAVVEAKA